MDSILQLYLVWIIVGIVLMVGYVYLGTSFVFWVAGGLAFVALMPFQLPELSDTPRVVTWVILATLYLLACFALLPPPGKGKKSTGIPKHVLLGETGQLTKSSTQPDKILIKFPYTINGSSTWPTIPLGQMEIGDQVEVVDIVGRSLVVRKPGSSSESISNT